VFAESFVKVEKIIGSKLILFFEKLLPELGLSLQEFLPYQDTELYDHIVGLAIEIHKYSDESPFILIRLNRYYLRAMLNWLELTNGKKENPTGIEMDIMNLKHKWLLKDGIEKLCPVCPNMMVLGYNYSEDISEEMGEPVAFPENAECAYCGLYITSELTPYFFELFNLFSEFDLGKAAEDKSEMENEESDEDQDQE
jgi:hypothetical protein